MCFRTVGFSLTLSVPDTQNIRCEYEATVAANPDPAPGEHSHAESGSGGTRNSTTATQQQQQRSTAPFPFLVNFPDRIAEDNVRRATIVHLDTSIGDMRQVQAILRALAVFLYQENFAERLDVEDEYVLPFANGVLDLRYGILRPGRPEDMVMRGPSYQWLPGGFCVPSSYELLHTKTLGQQDYRACDADVNAAEHLLTTLFPGRIAKQS